jgi:hypothetical protein
MATLKSRVVATDRKLQKLNEAPKAASKARRNAYKLSEADKDRKIMLVGTAVLRAVESGRWSETDFRHLMDDALYRQTDRNLFDLD